MKSSSESAQITAKSARSPLPRVRMRGFGASSLDFDLLVWIEHPEHRGRIRHELLMKIYKTLGELDIEIPYTKQDVYIKELPPRQGEGRRLDASGQ